jgi:MFS family permease
MEGNYPTQREATGMAWVAMLATVNTSLQLFLPAWVRGRGPSVYQMVLFGAQGLGAVVWGAATDAFGLRLAFLVAAGLMAAGTASVRVWPLADTSQMDRSTVVRPTPTWPSKRAPVPGRLWYERRI